MRALIQISWFVLIATVALYAPATTAQYFINGDKQVPLWADSTKVIVRFLDTIEEQQIDNTLNMISRISSKLTEHLAFDDFMAIELNSKEDYDGFVDSLRGVPGIDLVEPYYTTKRGIPHFTGATIFARFVEGVSKREIDSLATSLGISEVTEPTDWRPYY